MAEKPKDHRRIDINKEFEKMELEKKQEAEMQLKRDQMREQLLKQVEQAIPVSVTQEHVEQAIDEVKLSGIPRPGRVVDLGAPKVVDYRILSYPLQMMRMKVLELIGEGYEPAGSVIVDSRDGTFHQVMVKRL